MKDFAHWDFAERFSAYEAAALMLGCEPRDSDTEQWRVNIVVNRIELAYKNAVDRCFLELTLSDVGGESIEQSPGSIELMSVEMSSLREQARLSSNDSKFAGWLSSNSKISFDRQEFDRQALARWIQSIGVKSVYQFKKSPSSFQKEPAVSMNSWPWGNHHTEALGHLEAAARRFWVNYDPSDATTAATNTTVSEWVQTERKVSRTMADAIASMLRPDGLPTGPRK